MKMRASDVAFPTNFLLFAGDDVALVKTRTCLLACLPACLPDCLPARSSYVFFFALCFFTSVRTPRRRLRRAFSPIFPFIFIRYVCLNYPDTDRPTDLPTYPPLGISFPSLPSHPRSFIRSSPLLRLLNRRALQLRYVLTLPCPALPCPIQLSTGLSISTRTYSPLSLPVNERVDWTGVGLAGARTLAN